MEKRNIPKALNDYKPVALTSLVMKIFENMAREEIQAEFDPLQFAYRSCRGFAFNISLNVTVTHLEGAVFSATTSFIIIFLLLLIVSGLIIWYRS